jgi:hypothetical protein
MTMTTMAKNDEYIATTYLQNVFSNVLTKDIAFILLSSFYKIRQFLNDFLSVEYFNDIYC